VSEPSKTVAFLTAHPAQIRVLRPVAEAVAEFARVKWVLRDKDCSVALADAFGLDYVMMSKASSGLLGNALEMGANLFRCLRVANRDGIDLWVTKYGCGNMAARLTGKRSLSFNDDDVDLVPLCAWTSYPFADMVLVTQFTRMGRFERKAVRFAGLTELFYLHPARFTADKSVRQELGLSEVERYAIVRLSALQAHHDRGIRGVSHEFLQRLIKLTKGRMRLFVSSEKPLHKDLERLRYPIPAERILHALAFADFFLGDSQTMTSEAAVLGTPAFRINDFVGRISYLEDLEDYKLAFGFRPGQEDELVAELENLLNTPNHKVLFAKRRDKLLKDKIDPVPWLTHVIRMALEGAGHREVKDWAQSQYGLS